VLLIIQGVLLTIKGVLPIIVCATNNTGCATHNTMCAAHNKGCSAHNTGCVANKTECAAHAYQSSTCTHYWTTFVKRPTSIVGRFTNVPKVELLRTNRTLFQLRCIHKNSESTDSQYKAITNNLCQDSQILWSIPPCRLVGTDFSNILRGITVCHRAANLWYWFLEHKLKFVLCILQVRPDDGPARPGRNTPWGKRGYVYPA
jgi:hypothetical protein